MRNDAWLLDRAIECGSPRPLLRIYAWNGPALSVGAHQRLSPAVLDRCHQMGVQVVRRPTGGSAVVHGADITYAVVARHGPLGVLETYREVAQALIVALSGLGITAGVGTRHGRNRQLAARESPACFGTTVGADLEVDGAKICGSAQVRRRGWFLQHGSIPLEDQRDLTRRLLNHNGPLRSTCIELLRPGTSEDELSGWLVSAFTSRWGTPRETTLDEERGVEWSRPMRSLDIGLLNPRVSP